MSPSLKAAVSNFGAFCCVTLSHLEKEGAVAKDLFFNASKKIATLSKSIDTLNQRYGKKTIIYGATGLEDN